MSRLTFKSLSNSERQWLIQTLFNSDFTIVSRNDQVKKKFGITERTVWNWRKKLKEEMEEELSSNPYLAQAKSRVSGQSSYYLFTWAQNATPVHLPFLDNIRAYADFLDAEIHVIPGRYRNPSLYYGQEQVESNEWWDDELAEYLNSNRDFVHNNVLYAVDVKIQPTAKNALRGFESLAGGKTAIFGHPRIQLQSMPSLPGHQGSVHMSTGACTLRNYSDTKAGKKAEHHHMFGFVILEIVDDEHYHIRQVSAAVDGSFTDLFFHVSGSEVSQIDSSKGFVMGDIHLRHAEVGVINSTLRYFDYVKPSNVVMHDIFDGESVNHHIKDNPFELHHLMESGADRMADEYAEVVSFLEAFTEYNPVLVYSNHCEWIDRYLARGDWKKDLPNAKTYLLWASLMLEHRPEEGMLHFLLDRDFGNRIQCLGPDQSYKIGPWEVSTHGHLGINGSRGSMTSFRKFNTKVIFGHFHSCARYEGAVQVGTYTKKRLGYTKGPSNWSNCGAVIHNDDKVQQLIFTKIGENFEYTTLEDRLTT